MQPIQDAIAPFLVQPTMSQPTIRQLLCDFAICASLSFFIILGVIRALLHLLHIYFLSDLAHISPSFSIWLSPVVRIAEANACFLTVFKLTIACTVLVFAAREIIFLQMDFWRKEDIEAGQGDFCDTAVLSWTPDEKKILPELV
jgi:hypothetical protein